MVQSSQGFLHQYLRPTTGMGALVFGIIFLCFAITLAAITRGISKRAEKHLTDVTALRFAASLVQVLIFIIGFIIYAHLIPELRALGTALLAGVSVISLVIGLAAQNTLGNLISGLSIVLYRSVSVGDRVQLGTPKGLVTATIESLSLGYTLLRDSEGAEIIVPNSVMASGVVVRLSRRNAKA
ncbi:MAG: mechanosensitive ion channel [Candidatus Krumholzibacteria bacterium]|nr:mechanosensitive ion channel [Candidatus Krumholzibacteria bacterium]